MPNGGLGSSALGPATEISNGKKWQFVASNHQPKPPSIRVRVG